MAICFPVPKNTEFFVAGHFVSPLFSLVELIIKYGSGWTLLRLGPTCESDLSWLKLKLDNWDLSARLIAWIGSCIHYIGSVSSRGPICEKSRWVAGLPITFLQKVLRGDPQQHCPRPSLSNLTYGFLALMHHACIVECDKNIKKCTFGRMWNWYE